MTVSLTPRVSVLLPVYNGMPGLPATVESVLGQTFEDFELLAVNDGSADGSGEKLEEFAAQDGRVRVLHQANGGIVSALQRGMSESRAEFIARIDAGDRAYPERFARQVTLLDARPEVAVVGTAAHVDDGVSALGVWEPPITPALVRWELHFGVSLTHPTVMMRREAVEAVGGYLPDAPHNEDYSLWQRVAERYDLVNLRDPLVVVDTSSALGISRKFSDPQHKSSVALALRAMRRWMPDADPGVVADLRDLLYSGPIQEIDATSAAGRIGAAARLLVALRDRYTQCQPQDADEVRRDVVLKLQTLETALRWRAGMGRVTSMREYARWDARAFGRSLGQRLTRRLLAA